MKIQKISFLLSLALVYFSVIIPAAALPEDVAITVMTSQGIMQFSLSQMMRAMQASHVTAQSPAEAQLVADMQTLAINGIDGLGQVLQERHAQEIAQEQAVRAQAVADRWGVFSILDPVAAARRAWAGVTGVAMGVSHSAALVLRTGVPVVAGGLVYRAVEDATLRIVICTGTGILTLMGARDHRVIVATQEESARKKLVEQWFARLQADITNRIDVTRRLDGLAAQGAIIQVAAFAGLAATSHTQLMVAGLHERLDAAGVPQA